MSSVSSSSPLPVSAEALRAPFGAAPEYQVGIEDEVMLLDASTLELTDRAEEVLAMTGDDPRFKPELPASQLEVITAPTTSVPAAAAALLDGRRALVAASAGIVSFAGAGAHPSSPGVGKLSRGRRYERMARQYGCIARRELVAALQVHVSVGESDRSLAVYNAARSYLPLLAALAANAPFYEGLDTGLASVRPKLAELLPRHGIPPAIGSWQSYLDTLAWGRASGAFADPTAWWWDLRLHPRFGTLEFRVPDAQSTVDDAAAIAAVTQALVAWLGARHDAGERLAVDERWRIEENSWLACRDGVQGDMADLRTGKRGATRAILHRLLDLLQPIAEQLGAGAELAHARHLCEVNGAIAQRRVAEAGGVPAVREWLADRFLSSEHG